MDTRTLREQLCTVDSDNVISALRSRVNYAEESLAEHYILAVADSAYEYFPAIGIIADLVTDNLSLARANEMAERDRELEEAEDFEQRQIIINRAYNREVQASRAYALGASLAGISLVLMTIPYRPGSQNLVESPKIMEEEMYSLGDSTLIVADKEALFLREPHTQTTEEKTFLRLQDPLVAAAEAVCSRLGTDDCEVIMEQGLLRNLGQLQMIALEIGSICMDILELDADVCFDPAAKGAAAVYGCLEAMIGSAELITNLIKS